MHHQRALRIASRCQFASGEGLKRGELTSRSDALNKAEATGPASPTCSPSGNPIPDGRGTLGLRLPSPKAKPKRPKRGLHGRAKACFARQAQGPRPLCAASAQGPSGLTPGLAAFDKRCARRHPGMSDSRATGRGKLANRRSPTTPAVNFRSVYFSLDRHRILSAGVKPAQSTRGLLSPSRHVRQAFALPSLSLSLLW